ncbi:three-Cys-motif partner protein TcmP [Nocardia cyriacigeorgica]|uniref:three-Cys-motif partner protein TcmP n=1 Tax=Nocardia cyriacigeorgica TaxID=135487 RepID=UPI001894EDF2|nr:three-Cys-motif partner protein TcmP [Nocardia cyriacigeorgica]MBF6097679.1 three-Cys-motif partner protein TcmP [Nocardia cyriacigeorgica]MBF6161678.1 three-Cys-motif partner protein TcmP [Nocardia cyriacigeorgica]MBF6200476.1 three-Cys-motif partner protein TcmP [Nocardia cyriacigeorgica]MBF6342060.1 three-Cys-motif partner protein TcmP [Nocardia cyriacigeorgica]MBF6512976.1 three-Cys-motif partner protein TcmP [Nocardia cyriacigeorgica]
MAKRDSLPTVWTRPPHTKAKHDILTRYLGAWFGIFGHSRHPRVNVLDGFAGPGRYDDGEPGSPVLTLDSLLDHQSFSGFGNTQFNFIFNEWDAERYASLREVLAGVRTKRTPWPTTVRVVERNQNFQELARELLAAIPAGKRLAPTFAFIDPFGYRDVPMALIRDLVSHPSCELFIYFDFNSVNRFANAGNVDQHFTALFGCDEYKEAPAGDAGRAQFIHDLYERQLRKECDFAHVCSFAMVNEGGHIGSYLFFCTRDDQAYDKMKQAMWALAPGGGYRFDDRLAGQPVLFEDEANTGPLQDELAQHFGGRTVPVQEITQYVVRSTPFHSGQVKVKTLKPMQAAGRIFSPNQKKKGTFPDGTMVAFPAQD